MANKAVYQQIINYSYLTNSSPKGRWMTYYNGYVNKKVWVKGYETLRVQIYAKSDNKVKQINPKNIGITSERIANVGYDTKACIQNKENGLPVDPEEPRGGI